MTLWPPIALVHFEPQVVLKRFRTADDCETEAQWYRRYPQFCPELVDVDGPDLVTRRLPVAWETPEWRDTNALVDLLLNLAACGVHHRDVHLRNIVLDAGRPLLIDWYTATEAIDRPSYDLYGEAAGLARPEGHIDYQSWSTKNRWSIEEAWGVDVSTAVARWEDGRRLAS